MESLRGITNTIRPIDNNTGFIRILLWAVLPWVA